MECGWSHSKLIAEFEINILDETLAALVGTGEGGLFRGEHSHTH